MPIPSFTRRERSSSGTAEAAPQPDARPKAGSKPPSPAAKVEEDAAAGPASGAGLSSQLSSDRRRSVFAGRLSGSLLPSSTAEQARPPTATLSKFVTAHQHLSLESWPCALRHLAIGEITAFWQRALQTCRSAAGHMSASQVNDTLGRTAASLVERASVTHSSAFMLRPHAIATMHIGFTSDPHRAHNPAAKTYCKIVSRTAKLLLSNWKGC